jgi:HNH endonuclease
MVSINDRSTLITPSPCESSSEHRAPGPAMVDRTYNEVSTEGPRRDPRRLFSAHQRVQIADRQHHVCTECNEDLPGVFHVHHVVPWSDGGRTTVVDLTRMAPN